MVRPNYKRIGWASSLSKRTLPTPDITVKNKGLKIIMVPVL